MILGLGIPTSTQNVIPSHTTNQNIVESIATMTGGE